MAMQNRKTLKEYFKNGNLPTEDSFSDLIDSMVNIRSDGMSRTGSDGFCLISTGEHDRLLSFFKKNDEGKVAWTVDLSDIRDSIIVNNNSDVPNKDPFIVLTSDSKIGIRNSAPACELDINGTIRVSGRTGGFLCSGSSTVSIPADGEWHDLIANLDGCNAFEIVAGVGKKMTGKYALMHAIAINIFGNRGKIRYTQSYYLRRNNSIRLKWVGNQKGYKLKIRTMSDYGMANNKRICIRYNITKLWLDEFMDQ